jgi:hypothetical protein
MSAPIAATGPLKVLIKPIFIVCCAMAGAPASAMNATVPNSIFFMSFLQRAPLGK